MTNELVINKINYSCYNNKKLDLSGSDLRGMKFEHLKFKNVDFTDGDMRSAIFNFCTIENCKFDGTDMRGVKFDSCDIMESSLIEVNAKNMTVYQTTIVNTQVDEAISEMEFLYSDIDGKDPSDK